ncbi:hypothetical protein, conserved [Plasmodium gonderi]|uniref:Uncharacterized protein n=1 Tax=Plasmodium gonderi TaxID=77519 RepID=A0A1Y1JAD2_PLAGO|nr:hypothetical protein, conserved [Plasmodium gonderi]GAW79471.1 hypothetical protein, conserved [Plasmodium gonderi]
MEKTHFTYVLRNQIQDIFENYNASNMVDEEKISKNRNDDKEIQDLRNNDKFVNTHLYVDRKHAEVDYWRVRKKIDEQCEKELRDEKWNNKRREKNLEYESESIFVDDGKTLVVENYTSLIYENCEDKMNILLINKNIVEGRIEMQIKGKKDIFTLPCKLWGNVLSSFLPQLERGVYDIFFFINKEMMMIKLLTTGMDNLCKNVKCLTLHVIEISNFGHVSYGRKDRLPHYNIRVKNNVYTNKELLKLYNVLYKKYNHISSYEQNRNGRIRVGENYKLETDSDSQFYDLLASYKNAYSNQTLSSTGKGKKKKNLNLNNINFVSSLNFEQNVEQSRIPILYKKLLYDQCDYQNKKTIMHFHTKVVQIEPTGGFCTHIFTQNELQGDYSIFAFNLVPTFLGNVNIWCREAFPVKSMKKEKKNYLSSLLIFRCDNTSCSDMRFWKYVKTIKCEKNDIAKYFYINKRDGVITDMVQCPVPPELINNKNIFKKYSQGIKISEQVSIFFERWDDDVLPIRTFIRTKVDDKLYYTKIKELTDSIKKERENILSFDDFCEKNQEELTPRQKTNLHAKQNFIKSVETEKNENRENLEKNSSLPQNDNQMKGITGKGQKCPTIEYLHNNFVSFVIILNGKIYHSVIPISNFLLLFVVNYWMHFVDSSQ